MTRKSSRNNLIEFMRFIFALIVMLFHYFHINDDMDTTVFGHGAVGVEFFFLVSGFFMAARAEKQWTAAEEGARLSVGRTSIRFALGKLKTIIVPAYLVWLVSFVIAHVTDYRTLGVMRADTVIFDLVRSTFELLFLRNAGFRGYYVMNHMWYISAMLIAMLPMYALLLRWKDRFSYCAAPLTAAMVLGYLSHEYNNIVNVTAFVGVMYKTQLRAFGMLNLGVTCYAVGKWLRGFRMTRAGKNFLSVLEIWFYGQAICYMCWADEQLMDFVAVAFLAIAVTITLSQPTWLQDGADRIPGVCSALGNFSLYLYLAHVAICKFIVPILSERYGHSVTTFIISMALIFVLALLVKLLSQLIYQRLLPALRRAFVAPGD